MTTARPTLHHDAATSVGLPSSIIQISGPHKLLDDPGELIRQAICTLKASKAVGSNHHTTAKKVFGLLYAASLRAKSIGQWRSLRPYDPLADFVELKALAADRLGPPCSADVMVSQVRAAIDESVRVYSEQSA